MSASSSSSAAAAAPARGAFGARGAFAAPMGARASVAAAAADPRETRQNQEITALLLLINNPISHPTLHTIMTHYDILKDAGAPPGVSGSGKVLLKKTLSKVTTPPAKTHINKFSNPLSAPRGESTKTASADFFQTLDLAIKRSTYKSIIKKMKRENKYFQ